MTLVSLILKIVIIPTNERVYTRFFNLRWLLMQPILNGSVYFFITTRLSTIRHSFLKRKVHWGGAVMKKWNLLLVNGYISSQLSFTKLGYMQSFASGTLPVQWTLALKLPVTMWRNKDMKLWYIAISWRYFILCSVFLLYWNKLNYDFTSSPVYIKYYFELCYINLFSYKIAHGSEHPEATASFILSTIVKLYPSCLVRNCFLWVLTNMNVHFVG